MKRLRRVFHKLFRLFTNSREEAELAREIAAHLALLEDDYLRQGMAPEEARQAAKRAYGGVERPSKCTATTLLSRAGADYARHAVHPPPTS